MKPGLETHVLRENGESKARLELGRPEISNVGPGAIPTFPGWAWLVGVVSLLFVVAWEARRSTSRTA